MSAKIRRANKIKKRFLWYLLFLLSLELLVVFYYFFNLLSHPLFVSPLVSGVIQGSDLEKKLTDAKILFSSIHFNSDASYAIIDSLGRKITMSSKKNIDQQISSLQRILRELTIEGKSFKSIDFRFEKPIVEFY